MAFIAREAERMSRATEGKKSELLSQIAVGCMVAMALPAFFQSVGILFKGICGFEGIGRDRGDLSHVQRLRMRDVGRRLDEREHRRSDAGSHGVA